MHPCKLLLRYSWKTGGEWMSGWTDGQTDWGNCQPAFKGNSTKAWKEAHQTGNGSSLRKGDMGVNRDFCTTCTA